MIIHLFSIFTYSVIKWCHIPGTSGQKKNSRRHESNGSYRASGTFRIPLLLSELRRFVACAGRRAERREMGLSLINMSMNLAITKQHLRSSDYRWHSTNDSLTVTAIHWFDAWIRPCRNISPCQLLLSCYTRSLYRRRRPARLLRHSYSRPVVLRTNRPFEHQKRYMERLIVVIEASASLASQRNICTGEWR